MNYNELIKLVNQINQWLLQVGFVCKSTGGILSLDINSDLRTFFTYSEETCYMEISPELLKAHRDNNHDQVIALTKDLMGDQTLASYFYARHRYGEEVESEKQIKLYQQIVDMQQPKDEWQMLALVDIYSLRGNQSKAIETIHEMIEVAKAKNNSWVLGWCYRELGHRYERHHDDLEHSEKYLMLAMKVFKEDENHHDLARAWLGRANIPLVKGDFKLSLSYLETAMEIKKNNGCTHGLVSNMRNLGILYFNRGEFDKASEYFQKTYESYRQDGEKYHHSRHAGYLWTNALLRQNRIEEAKQRIESIRDSIKEEKQNENQEKPNLYFKKAEMLTSSRTEVPLLLRTGDFDSALDLISSIFEFYKDNHPPALVPRMKEIINDILYLHHHELLPKLLPKWREALEHSPDQRERQATINYDRYIRILNDGYNGTLREKLAARDKLEDLIKDESLHYNIKINLYTVWIDLLLYEYGLEENEKLWEKMRSVSREFNAFSTSKQIYRGMTLAHFLNYKIAMVDHDFDRARAELNKAIKVVNKYGYVMMEQTLKEELDQLEVKILEAKSSTDPSLKDRLKQAKIEQYVKMAKSFMNN